MNPPDRLRLAARLCARAALGHTVDADSAIARDDVAALLETGRENRCLSLLAPFLRPHLSAAGAREIDQVLATSWASHHLTAATLAPVFRQASARGVPVIVYKGAASAARLYSEPWRRQMQDIDLLVEPAGLPVMQDLLTAAGYRLLITPRRSRSVELSHEKTYVNDKEGVRIVDLHVHPAPPHRHPLATAGLLARSSPARLFDAPVQFLAPEDELIVTAVNQAYDHFRGSLLRAVDGALLMNHETLDWNRVLQGAREARACVTTWITLRWMTDLTGADVPSDVIQTLRPDPGRAAWLSLLLGSATDPTPRFRMHRRLEQVFLTMPLMDDMTSFWSYAGRHLVRRVIDAWRALGSEEADPPPPSDKEGRPAA